VKPIFRVLIVIAIVLIAIDVLAVVVLRHAWRGGTPLIDSRIYQYGRTPLIEAANIGNVLCVNVLLADGANVNAVDRHGNTALGYASWQGHVDCLKALITHGANVNAVNNSGRTSLYFASCAGQTAAPAAAGAID